MSEMERDQVTCLRIPRDLEEPVRTRIDDILNQAAGGDYISHIKRERLVDPELGFTLNNCCLDLCLDFKLSAEARVALNVRGVEFLPASSKQTMNMLRY